MRHDTEGIRSGGKKIGQAGEDLGEVLNTLVAALDSQGQCWGNDEAGQEFAKDYVPASDGCRNALQQLVQALGQIDENLQQTAAESEQIDQHGASEIGKAPS
jgi:uncharacterized protein YukE